MNLKTKSIPTVGFLVVFTLLVGAANTPVAAQYMDHKPMKVTSSKTEKMKQSDFQNAMRKLWEDHITWTRLYIVEAVAGLPGANKTAGRLLKNQEDIGNAIKPFYGDAAGDKLTALLKEHILGAVAVLTAAKAGDTAKLKTANEAWYKNGDDIALFLSGANPKNWSGDALKGMMKMHLDDTLSEAVAQLKGDYDKAIAEYDKVHDHILMMADALSGGIIKQFPKKFRK